MPAIAVNSSTKNFCIEWLFHTFMWSRNFSCPRMCVALCYTVMQKYIKQMCRRKFYGIISSNKCLRLNWVRVEIKSKSELGIQYSIGIVALKLIYRILSKCRSNKHWYSQNRTHWASVTHSFHALLRNAASNFNINRIPAEFDGIHWNSRILIFFELYVIVWKIMGYTLK